MSESYQFSMALRDIWDVISLTNKFIADEGTMGAREGIRRSATELNAVLYQSADVLRVVAALIEPVMPNTSQNPQVLGIAPHTWPQFGRTLAAGHPARARSSRCFHALTKTVEELRQMADQETPAPQHRHRSPRTCQPNRNPATGTQHPEPGTWNRRRWANSASTQFMNVELRTAKVIAAEAVPKSKKLIKLQVDLGTEQRTILAGIAEAYQPESLVGRTIVIVANLKPAKLMGIESNGMVLAASPEGGKPVLVTVEAEPGWRVR